MAPRVKRATEETIHSVAALEEMREHEAAERAAVAPLFADVDAEELQDIQIHRTDPVEEEGFLGVVPLATTEENIRARWGGGRFKLVLRNTGNKLKGTKHIVISGDPIWTSRAKKEAHYRGKGLTLEDDPRAAPPAPAPAGIGISEITGIFTTMMQMQAQADDRRARETAAADERRAREQDARDERRRKEEQESREREREHTTQMLLLIKESVRGGGGGGDQGAGPALLEAFTSGMKSAVAMLPAVQPAPAGGRGGDGDDDDDDDERGDDPVASAIQGIARVVIDRLGPGGAPAAAAAAPAAAGRPADEGVTLVGPLGEKVAALANAAKAANMDVTALLAQGIDNIHAYVAKKGAAPALAAVTPPAPFVPDQPLPPPPLNPLAAAAAALQAEQRNGTSSATAS